MFASLEAESSIENCLDILPSSDVSLRSLARSFSKDRAISSCNVLLAVSADSKKKPVLRNRVIQLVIAKHLLIVFNFLLIVLLNDSIPSVQRVVSVLSWSNPLLSVLRLSSCLSSFAFCFSSRLTSD